MTDRIVSVDDNFDLPVQTRNRLASQHGLRIVDPALGDGVTDATAAIQSALNRAGTDGGTVLIPAGRFMKRPALQIPDGVTIQGLGRQSRIENYTSGDGAAVLTNANTNGGGGITIRSLDLIGVKGVGSVAFSTLHLFGTRKHSYIHDVYAQGGNRNYSWPHPDSGRGECIELQLCSNIMVSDVWVDDAEYDGFKIRGSDRVQVTNIRATNCTKDGIQFAGHGGVEMGMGPVVMGRHVTVTNALIENETGVGSYGNPAITWHDTVDCRIDGLTILGTGLAFTYAGANTLARVSNAVVMPRDGMGHFPQLGMNMTYQPFDESVPPVHYAYWGGDNQVLFP